MLEHFSYRADKPISKLAEQLNEDIDTMIYQKLSYRPIMQWLRENDYLITEVNQETGQTYTLPTEKGLSAGISCEKRINSKGEEYFSILYGRQIQELIVQNMASVLNPETYSDSES
ncbi:MAG: hypothetical protein LIO94_05230 [Clostridiales bacterium]|nr:hypothetical protein [Clostridiales bacterium]